MTQLLVLGLLKEKPLSGYDIQMMLQASAAEKWGGVLVGSIYHALKKLEKDGYAEISSVEQTGHRQKVIYQITKNGLSYLHDLIAETIQNPSVCFPTSFYSGLNFTDYLTVEEYTSSLIIQKKKLETECNNLSNELVDKKQAMNNELPTISELVFENMFSIINQQIDFVDKLLKLIQS